jgi:hypothetical protein
MVSATYLDQAASPAPGFRGSLAHTLHLDALTLVSRLRLLDPCRVAVSFLRASR